MTTLPALRRGPAPARPGAWQRPRRPWTARNTAVVAACGVGAASALSGLLAWSRVVSGASVALFAGVFGLVVAGAAVAIGRATVQTLDDPLPDRRPTRPPWVNAPRTKVGWPAPAPRGPVRVDEWSGTG